MRVLFVTNPDRGLRTGGVRVQIGETRRQLEAHGVVVVPCSPWEDGLDGVDLCHVFQAHHTTHAFAVAARRRGVPLVVSPVLGAPRLPPRAHRLLLELAAGVPGVCVGPIQVRETLRLADALLALSATEARWIVEGYSGVAPGRVRIVPNGVEERFGRGSAARFVEAFGFAPDVLFVGRLDRNKNLLGLIGALRGAGLRLAVVGAADAPDDGYAAACRRAGAGFCTFLGRLDRDGDLLPAAYAAARVLALPSRSEVFPLAVLEAGLAGCNVVLTRNSALPPELAGFVDLVDPGRPGEVRRAVVAAAGRPRNGALAAVVAAQFGWEGVGERVLAVYGELLGRRRPVPGASAPA